MEEALVEAALAAAQARGQDVARVPISAIAAFAGISRSTLLRRLGGSRTALDEAVRQAGHDPGDRRPVRDRAVDAAATLIATQGLGAVTLDEVARAARCSLPSLHAIFDGRDGLLTEVFVRYGPVLDLEALAADPPVHVEDTVRAIHAALVKAFTTEPRVVPALFADLLSRPGGPGSQVVNRNLPRLLTSLAAVLEPHRARLRPMPLTVLAHQLIGPLLFHLFQRPYLPDAPPLDEAATLFADAFLHAVLLP